MRMLEDRGRTAFDVGWDHAAHGVSIPADFPTDRNMINGYETAKSKVGVVGAADRYVRKWLQLRRNAWVRNIVFGRNVTPEFLREIDSDSCPILEIPLTHATGQDSDWSVDRALNALPYMRGNIVIMSARANLAKASFDLEQILHFAQAPSGTHGLSSEQWMRMHELLLPAKRLLEAEGFFPLSREGLPVNCNQALRDLMTELLAKGGPAALDESNFPFFQRKEARRATTRLLGEMLRSLDRYTVPGDIWGRKRLHRLFDLWLKTLRRPELVSLAVALYNGYARRGRIADERPAFDD